MNLYIDLQIASENTAGLPTAAQFQHWVDKALAMEAKTADYPETEITIRIVDEAESHELNLTYRAKTNRLTYSLSRLKCQKGLSYRCWGI